MNHEKTFALKGDVVYTAAPGGFTVVEQGYAVCENGRSAGVFCRLPEQFDGIRVEDCGQKLIIPGLVDLHLHAPQYSFRGLGMDLEPTRFRAARRRAPVCSRQSMCRLRCA